MNDLKDLWYQDYKKVVPIQFVKRYISPFCLATWYQDDGHLKKRKNTPQKLILSTDCFSRRDVEQLQKLLKETYSLNFHQDGQNRLLLYDQPSIYYFLTIIRPYLTSCMRRKDIFLKAVETNKTKSLRTTIYLPETFILTKPTSELRDLLHSLKEINRSLSNSSFYQKAYTLLQNAKYESSSDQKSYQVTLTGCIVKELKAFKRKTGRQYGEAVHLCKLNKNGRLI
ncbi:MULTISPECIES: hypothetical protein [Pontibacillus]|uniref:Homing endonuclease LAGLIDADG domain-containing protein n=1 Tax=Pontibacillus chungwhensis TaxID=265426 RepID=A0ABY8UX82_9BACI|nr:MULTISPECIES: hypothetical protein [Pontibacillus]MCD5325907.1 hypothetical protein [Pontibacillus sp. HN14]WIF97617.1 hypothetical protein QNI29_18095 [Pontibacillus chungwhensis]